MDGVKERKGGHKTGLTYIPKPSYILHKYHFLGEDNSKCNICSDDTNQ